MAWVPLVGSAALVASVVGAAVVASGVELGASLGWLFCLGSLVGVLLGVAVALVVASLVGCFFLVSDPFSDLPSLTCWIVVPSPPERERPVASSTAVSETAAMPNAASAATATRFQFSFGPRGVGAGCGSSRWLRWPAT